MTTDVINAGEREQIDRWMDSVDVARLGRALIVCCFACSLMYSLYRIQQPHSYVFRRYEFPQDSKWICATGDHNYGGFFRKEFRIVGQVKHAWIVVAPCMGYELIINGNPQSQWHLWRPTRPFQTGITEYGQRIANNLPTLALNFPREYQWTGHKNYLIPPIIDVTHCFRTGRNVICFEIESREAPARIRFTGEIELTDGTKIPIRSDESFRACLVPRGTTHDEWATTKVQSLDWKPSIEAPTPPPGIHYRHVPDGSFERPFSGKWIFCPDRVTSSQVGLENPKGSVNYFFRKKWRLRERPDQAYIRLVSTRPTYIFVNGQLVDPVVPYSKQRTGGEWLINARPPSPRGAPELMDPDEVGDIFVGTRFENPRHGDPTVNEFRRHVNMLNKTHDHPFQRQAELASTHPDSRRAGREADPLGPIDRPEETVPKSLLRNVAEVKTQIYGIANLMQAGDNEILIRSVDDYVRDFRKIGPPQIAADLGAVGRSGKWCYTETGLGWDLYIGSINTTPISSMKYRSVDHRPNARFEGHASIPPFRTRRAYALATIIMLAVVLLYRIVGGLVMPDMATSVPFLVPATVVMVGVRLLQLAFKENHEVLPFYLQKTWIVTSLVGVTIPIAGVLAVALWLRLKRWVSLRCFRDGARCRPGRGWRPSRREWFGVALTLLLLMCGALRAHELDFQTLDDDEYASVQAALAIAKCGAPAYLHDIYYSRSPFHHYYAGLLVWLISADIWVLRMGQVVLGVATAWLLYVIAVDMLKSRWIGLATVILYSWHPFLIFSSHVARFYQQQQFFAVLCVYLFYKGFVQKAHAAWRYATLAAFLGALLSQETSAVLGLSMGIAFLAFCPGLKTSDLVKCGVLSALVIASLIVDFIAFQANCLTRVEGVSPNVEATVKPNFTYVVNFFSMFVAYARLHVVISLFVVIGCVYAVVRRDRAFLYLATMVFTGILFGVTFISGVSLRYQFWVIAPWILMSAYGIACFARTIGRLHRDAAAFAPSELLVGVLMFGIAWASFCPWRVPGSYRLKLLGDATGAFRYVRANLRPGDKVGGTEPHPHAALLETGQSDFDIAFPLLWDFTHKHYLGYTLDRNGGALALSNMADLQKACAQNDRIWFCINREKFRSRSKNLCWEYPSARAELFLRKNCRLQYRTYLWSVYLWDKNLGEYSAFRREF